ncbi:mpv17-like protein [Bacillus rossius redtenbacheri]|uniref:mpv17-like protein n=1 Tax=Bacillus rossius redtenbacheri TaxID=93214 RepID=UPI002FDC882F
MAALLRKAFQKYPYVSNCLTYGTLYVGAEFLQQTLTRKILAEGDAQPYDKGSLVRYAIVGNTIYPTMLYTWYKWLDKRFVGTAARTVVKKLVLDQLIFTPPVIIAFYISMSILERKDDIFEECKTKLLPTFKTSCLFWPPAQLLNFLLVPPAARVVFVGGCALVWVNILCWFKRQDY